MATKRIGFGSVGVSLLLCGCNVPPAAVMGDDAAAVDPRDMAMKPPSACELQGLPERPWNATGPYGQRRDELADDFTVTDQNGEWKLSKNWSGCDSYVIIPDNIPVSPLDSTSIWAQDLDGLIQRSPANVHYFFVSRRENDADVKAALEQIQSQIEGALSKLPEGAGPGQRDWWAARLHLSQTSARNWGGWVWGVLQKSGVVSTTGPGFAIDRFQRIRGLGNLADVNRFDRQLQAQMQWPWQNNLAMAANPPVYFNYEAAREELLKTRKGVKEVTVYDHEVVGYVVEKEVTLPPAGEMAAFDRFEVDLDMNCPDKSKIENNNCGPWDYLVHLWVQDQKDPMKWHEIARWISTYHRAGRYLVDATHALPELRGGGTRKLRYSVSPEWNKQAYDTVMKLRFYTEGGLKPSQATFLYSGGGFNADYNKSKTPQIVQIPAGAKKVELRAIITGHGGVMPDNCAEFCNHQHEFTVGGKVHLKEYPEVRDPEGCAAQIKNGVVPNQSGTWWFGRGGWCPGWQVDPWVVDVTGAATPGQPLEVSYRGLYGGRPVTMGRGDIVLSSWIVVWE